MSAPYVERWSEQAACQGQPVTTFFSNVPDQAKSICRRCPVRAECLYDALTHDTPNGVWGGLVHSERSKIPLLPRPKARAISALRVVLERFDPNVPAPPASGDEPIAQPPAPERTLVPTTPAPMTTPSSSATATAEALPVDQLLEWGDTHTDPEIQDQAARVRAGLVGLRRRHAADAELTAITREAEQLEQRLAELRAREAELAPPKKTKTTKKTAVPRDYEPATVRAWAKENGVGCPASGRVPKAVVDAWRAATGAQG